jgi:FKBP12-rapamycin complex-associated protein
MLAALNNFGPTLDDYIHLVLPPMVRLFDSLDVPWSVRKASLDAIDHLSSSLDFSEYAGIRVIECKEG